MSEKERENWLRKNQPKQPFVGVAGLYRFANMLDGRQDVSADRHVQHGAHKRYRHVRRDGI